MKKLCSVLLVLSMLFTLSVCALAWDKNDPVENMDKPSLVAAFQKGVGPMTEGYAIDYRYFSPVKENDTNKYPLVIWLHGMTEGGSDGHQITKNDIAFWASEDFQSRFAGGGAFILAARSPEEQLNYWGDDTVYPLRAAIDDFIAKNADHVDLTRIYIGGFSMGGKMTLNMTYAYPELFAAAFPICPAGSLSKDKAKIVANIPYWFVSGTGDPLVIYATGVVPTWNNVASANNRPEDCRFSTLSTVCYPDGNKTSSAHHAWYSVTFDMFSVENGDYPHMSTVNGLDETVTLTYPEGMISWLSQFTSNYDGTPATNSGNMTAVVRNPINILVSFFNKIFDLFRSIFENLFG
ncbi:MAG: prolyl oligopeptidase family serine peptidase [Clostridia bacterium]|nr:prolyl oligopeptidase family serine peptidase [Clostridia bacterium]